VRKLIAEADVVVGAVLIPGAKAPKLITREMLSGMKKGAVLVDVAIDQGGCFETSKATTHTDPIYVVDGVIHYCVANMPGAVAKTSTMALPTPPCLTRWRSPTRAGSVPCGRTMRSN
jgi:alanine dehydrogenase